MALALAGAVAAIAWPDAAVRAPVSGRIEPADASSGCGAALIAPDRFVTAAHCTPLGARGHVLRPGAGLDAPTMALADARRHPLWAAEQDRLSRFRYDIGVAILAEPVPAATMRPLPVGGPARVGETLHLEGWRLSEGPVPVRRACPVLREDAGLLTLGCAVASGHSGAPVLRLGPDGPELVAVTVATTRFLGEPAALATTLSTQADALGLTARTDAPARP